jgi:hypothetical protein
MKKVLAVVFLLISTFLTVTIVGFLINVQPITREGYSTARSLGSYVGHWTPPLLVVAAIFFLVKISIKWLKEKNPMSSQTIDEEFMKK